MAAVAPQAVARPIRFEVTRCTGEFEGHSGSELSKEPGPDNVGWLTPKFCEWPQEITLTLQTRVALSYVQVLTPAIACTHQSAADTFARSQYR